MILLGVTIGLMIALVILLMEVLFVLRTGKLFTEEVVDKLEKINKKPEKVEFIEPSLFEEQVQEWIENLPDKLEKTN